MVNEVLTVVTGPPCSGKTTYVREHATPGDIVIDIDALAQALGSPQPHGHADSIRYVARMARTAAITAGITCHHQGQRVWVEDASPAASRMREYHKAGATIVELREDPTVLHSRAAHERPELWHQLIDDWLKRHPTEAQRTTWGW